jgi:hypothetical protein
MLWYGSAFICIRVDVLIIDPLISEFNLLYINTYLEDDSVALSDAEYRPNTEDDADTSPETDADDTEDPKSAEGDVAVAPTQEQLSDITFETNRSGRFSAILVDGAKYRYVLTL